MKIQIIEKKNYWIVGLSMAVIALILLLVGVGLVLGSKLDTRNVLAFMAFSLLVGAIGAGMVFFRMKVGFIIFGSGLVLGYFEMFRLFILDLSGWGDLAGILSLFTWSLIGLALGLFAQLIFHLYKKFRKK